MDISTWTGQTHKLRHPGEGADQVRANLLSMDSPNSPNISNKLGNTYQVSHSQLQPSARVQAKATNNKQTQTNKLVKNPRLYQT